MLAHILHSTTHVIYIYYTNRLYSSDIESKSESAREGGNEINRDTLQFCGCVYMWGTAFWWINGIHESRRISYSVKAATVRPMRSLYSSMCACVCIYVYMCIMYIIHTIYRYVRCVCAPCVHIIIHIWTSRGGHLARCGVEIFIFGNLINPTRVDRSQCRRVGPAVPQGRPRSGDSGVQKG